MLVVRLSALEEANPERKLLGQEGNNGLGPGVVIAGMCGGFR